MPSIYLDAPFMDVVADTRDRLEREAQQELDGDETDPEVYIPEREAIMELLSDDAREKVQRRRDRRWNQ